MKKLYFIALLIFLIGCKEETPTEPETQPKFNNFTVSGKIQKGPFMINTPVSIQGLDNSLSIVSTDSATSSISDNEGSFESNISFSTATNAEVNISGFYFNENTGMMSTEQLSMSSYVMPTASGTNNLNLISNAVKDNIKTLKLAGSTLEESSILATQEFMLASIGQTVTTGSHEWTIFDDSPLLAFSVLVQHGRNAQGVQQWLGDIRNDFANGTISPQYVTELANAAQQIDHDQIQANILAEFGKPAQSFLPILEQLDPSRLINSVHAQGSGTVSSTASMGGTARFYTPFTLAQATTFKYMSLGCEASNIVIYDSTGNINGVYDSVLQQTLTINLGNQVATAAYSLNALPVRDYGNGLIRNHQATFAQETTLQAGQYWLGVDLPQGCSLDTYEAVSAQYMIMEGLPNYFVFPQAQAGANTIYFELLK